MLHYYELKGELTLVMQEEKLKHNKQHNKHWNYQQQQIFKEV